MMICFFVVSCNSQNSILTNKVFRSDDQKVGVKSKSGKILIDPEYKMIRPIYSDDRMTYNGIKNSVRKPLEYYLATMENDFKGIIDSNGKEVFGFRKCFDLQIDERTKTIIVVDKLPDHKKVYLLFDFKNKQLDNIQYQNIGYIENSDLIILVKVKRKEVYLLNINNNIKSGPYEHFIVWDENYDPTLGRKDVKFTKLKKPLGIGVRNKGIWGMIDQDGNEILPMKYSSMKIFSEEQKSHPFFKRVTMPEDVNIVLSTISEEKRKQTFYDENMIEYEIVNENPNDPANQQKVMIKSK